MSRNTLRRGDATKKVVKRRNFSRANAYRAVDRPTGRRRTAASRRGLTKAAR